MCKRIENDGTSSVRVQIDGKKTKSAGTDIHVQTMSQLNICCANRIQCDASAHTGRCRAKTKQSAIWRFARYVLRGIPHHVMQGDCSDRVTVVSPLHLARRKNNNENYVSFVLIVELNTVMPACGRHRHGQRAHKEGNLFSRQRLSTFRENLAPQC
jgi:hypothetical protein